MLGLKTGQQPTGAQAVIFGGGEEADNNNAGSKETIFGSFSNAHLKF